MGHSYKNSCVHSSESRGTEIAERLGNCFTWKETKEEVTARQYAVPGPLAVKDVVGIIGET